MIPASPAYRQLVKIKRAIRRWSLIDSDDDMPPIQFILEVLEPLVDQGLWPKPKRKKR